ncbi:HEAT repeat domain-containing protein [Escherichia coli]|nr:HEAT repeat domain-containing protein [Escherichia coli]
MSIKNDGHYFCRAGGNRPDGLNEPVTIMSMPPAIANTFLFEMMKSKSKDVTLAAIYALGEGRCQAENITRELHRLSQSDDMEIKIAAIKALGRIYR